MTIGKNMFRILLSSVIVHCSLVISSSAADPTIRNQAEFSAFNLVPPKLQILSAISDKAEYDPNKKVTLEIKIKNPEAADFDIAVDVTVTDPAGKDAFKKTGTAVTIKANGEVTVTQDFTLSKTAAAGGYALKAVVTFNKNAVATKDAANVFKVKQPAPLTISPTSVIVGRGKQQTFTAAGAQGKAVFSMEKIMPPNVYDFTEYGSFTGKVFTAGQFGGKKVKIIVKDELDRTAEAIAEVSSEVEITAPGGTEVEPGGRLPLGYAGGSDGEQVTFWIKSNKSGGKIDAQKYSWYFVPGSVTAGVVDRVCVKVNGTSKESCLDVKVTPASIEPKLLNVGPGQNFYFKVVGGVSGVTRTFKMNKGADQCGTINSSGNFTAGALEISADQAKSGVVELNNKYINAVVAQRGNVDFWKRMATNSILYADVAIKSNPLPLTISPTSADATEFEEVTFTFSGGKGTKRTFSVVEGQSYPAIKVYKFGGKYMAGHVLSPKPDRVRVEDDQGGKADAVITVKAPEEEDEGFDFVGKAWDLGGIVGDILGVGELVQLANFGYDLAMGIQEGNERENYVKQKYSEFGGSISQGPYKKGAIVTATNLNDPSQTVTSEVIDDNGRYYIKCPWDGPTKIEASGPFMDEFTGRQTKMQGEMSAVANGVDSKLVACDVNIPTTIAAEIVDRKLEKMKDSRKMFAAGQIDLTNEKVGQTICGKPGVDISEVEFGNPADPNSSKVTKFHVAVAALAGPNQVVDAAKQFAGEISTNNPVGSSGGVVSAADLKKTLDKIESGEPFNAKTSAGVISVRPEDVFRRLARETAPAPAPPEPAVAGVDEAKKILTAMADALNQKNAPGLLAPVAPDAVVTIQGRRSDAAGLRQLLAAALPLLDNVRWTPEIQSAAVDPKTGNIRVRVTSSYSADLMEPVGVTRAAVAAPAEVKAYQMRLLESLRATSDEIYEFKSTAGGLQLVEMVSGLPFSADLAGKIARLMAAWRGKVAVVGRFDHLEQNNLDKFADLVGADFVNNDDNGFKHNRTDFLESVKADLDHLTSIDHTVRVDDIQFNADLTSARVPVSWDRRARIANKNTEWTIKDQKTTLTLRRGPEFGLVQVEGKPLFGNSSRITRKTLIGAGELDGTAITLAIAISDARETATATSSDFPGVSLSNIVGSAVGTSQTFTYTGAVQTFTAPANLSFTIKAWGAGGGGGGWDVGTGGDGGGGAYATTTLVLAKGSVIQIYVGGGGDSGATSVANTGAGSGGFGYGSGGRGGKAGGTPNSGSGGGGGGSTAVTNQSGTTFHLVAAGGGGGGGAGFTNPNRDGGAGGVGGQNGTTASGAGGATGASGSKDGTDGGDRGAAADGGGGGGGGGGYAAGGTGGNAGSGDNGGGGGAGGNSTGTVTAGSGKTPGNSTDADLTAGLAAGGSGSTGNTVATRATPGGAGMVKISW